MTTTTKTSPPIRLRRERRTNTDPGKPPQTPPVATPPPKPAPQAKPPETLPKPAQKMEWPKIDSPVESSPPKPKPTKPRSRYRWSKPGRTGAQIWEQFGRETLTAEPQVYSPDGKPVLFGALRLFYLPKTDRPCLVVEVSGDPTRWFPWRFDWPVSPDTACLVESRGKGVWIKLQSALMESHQDTWLTGKIALEAWGEAQKQYRTAKKRDHNLDNMVETTRSQP